MNKELKIPANIELLKDTEVLEGAFASVSLNPLFQWAKIVVTDDKANLNKQRIPIEEFDNLIKTGLYSPIKMAVGEISVGHKEAYGHPIGTLTQLTKEGNRVLALAALWSKERPEDVIHLKEMYTNGTPPNVSWEIGYSESSTDEDGVEVLKGTVLNGMTVVGMPAYAGRTPFIAMSSEEASVTIEELQTKVSELETKITELNTQLAEKDTQLASLTEFKANAEKELQNKERIALIKSKFKEAGIEKEEAYFEDKKAELLAMTDETINFILQEMVAFSSEAAVNKEKKPKIPNIPETHEDINFSDPKELGRALLALKSKK